MEIIQVGDHDPEPRISKRRQAELFFTRKLQATAIELNAVTRKLDDATALFFAAQVNENYAILVDAGKAVVRYADQVAYLAGGIKIAIENEQQPQETRR